MSSILKIENLHKKYGAIHAVNGLNLEIEKGNVFGILGPNGSGKTTTLSVILGLIKPNEGSFCWFNGNGKDYKKRIGALVEVPYFYPYLTGEKNLKILAEIKNVPFENIARVLKFTHLYERRNTSFESFSLGMKQRLALSAALLGDPEVLILDEPTNGLDPEGIAEIREIIKSQAEKGKTIIIASHILDEIEKVCTHVAILKKGQLIKQGKVQEIIVKSDKIVLSSENLTELKELLQKSEFVSKIEITGSDIEIVIKDGFSAHDVSKFAAENRIILTKLLVKQKTLESQFLELVK